MVCCVAPTQRPTSAAVTHLPPLPFQASKSLKQAMWWKNVKMWGMMFLITGIIAWLIASFACGFDFSKCKGK